VSLYRKIWGGVYDGTKERARVVMERPDVRGEEQPKARTSLGKQGPRKKRSGSQRKGTWWAEEGDCGSLA